VSERGCFHSASEESCGADTEQSEAGGLGDGQRGVRPHESDNRAIDEGSVIDAECRDVGMDDEKVAGAAWKYNAGAEGSRLEAGANGTTKSDAAIKRVRSNAGGHE